MRKAIFLDRDGTLVHPVRYASRPEQIQVYEDAFPFLQNVQNAGFLLIVITNQSGIARGYLSESDLRAIHEYLTQVLAQRGVHLDAFYVCPHHPEGTISAFTCCCDCRKPEPGMLLQAASDFSIDLSASWCVGDMGSDIEAGRRAGCRTCLIRLNEPEHHELLALDHECPSLIVPSLSSALRMIQTS